MLEYYDNFISRPMRFLHHSTPEIYHPLHVVEAAAARLHLPRGYALKHEQPRSPSGYMRISLWPAQLQRFAIGFTLTASHRLATVPACKWACGPENGAVLETAILLRVMGGYVAKIQVHKCCSIGCDCGCAFEIANVHWRVFVVLWDF